MKDIPSEILSPEEFEKKFSNFQPEQSSKLPSQITLEANIMQFPLVSFRGDKRKERVWKKEVRSSEGAIETVQELKFFAPGDLKLANGLIDRKLQILAFHLWQKYGCQENGIFWFTLRGLAEFLQIAPNGTNLKKIKSALGRLQMTSIVSTNAIIKKTEDGVLTKQAEGYLSFFSNLQFIFTGTNDINDIESTRNLSFAQIHKFFINNFMKQYCGKIDLNLTLKLKRPESLGLYLILCSRPVDENNSLLLSLPSLIEDVPLDPSKTRVAEYERALKPTFNELKKFGVIESVQRKELTKSISKNEKKVDRIYYLIKISRQVREIQLSLFPDGPQNDESFVIDPVLSQMISLIGLDKETASKIMSSKEFGLTEFEDALKVTLYNKTFGKKEIQNTEGYIKSLAKRGVSLEKDQEEYLTKHMDEASKGDEGLKGFQLRPIPRNKKELVVYLQNLGMWANEAKNICKNHEIEKVVLQINGWLIKHEGEELASHIKELVAACKSDSGYETFNRTPFPSNTTAKKWHIEGYQSNIAFYHLSDAEEFCRQQKIPLSRIIENQ